MNIQTEIQEVEAQIKKVTAEREAQLNRRVRLLAVAQKQCDHCTSVTHKSAISEQGQLHQLIKASSEELIDLNKRLKGLQCIAPHERMDGEACA